MRRLLPEPSATDNAVLSDSEISDCYQWPSDEIGRPWVRANMVTSVDGRVTGSTRRSGDVSSAADRRVLRILRATCDAVLVGSTTALTETYGPVKIAAALADIRLSSGRTAEPKAVVATGSGRLPADCPWLTNPGGAIVLTCRTAKSGHLREVARVLVHGEQSVDLKAGIAELGRLGLRRILCEGGPTLLNSMLRAGLVDELCATTTPMLVGPVAPGMAGPGSLLAGPDWGEPPASLKLAGVLEEAGTLLCRWTINPHDRLPQATNAARP